MYRFSPRFIFFTRKCSIIKIVKPLSVNEGQKCVEMNSSELINTSETGASAINEHFANTEPISILEPIGGQVLPETCDISVPKAAPRVITDKTPLPFEDIPGPSILRFWEKYWKYVPLLGTQVFCSLLINRFAEGRLKWNRNVTPIKYLFNQYGCVVRIHGPLVADIVMIHRPEHIAEVFKQEGGVPIRSGIDILQQYRLNYRKQRFAGPFSSQGAEWLDLKEKVEEPFNQLASTSFNRIDMVCDELINRIRKTRNKQDEVPENFRQDLTLWSMECFASLVFNKYFGFLELTSPNHTSEAGRIMEALRTAHVYLNRCETGFQVWRFFETPFSKKLFEACDIIDGIIGKHIRVAQNKVRRISKSPAENNVTNVDKNLPILENLLLNERIHPDDISTLLMDMIILGVQAVANCEAFLLYFLAKKPRAQSKLYEEIISVSENKECALTEESLKSMPYLQACLKESLRLRPAFPYITRLLPNPISLHGYTIPKGTYVVMANQITSQREENFENADKFDPERWLCQSNNEGFYSEHSFLPFGHGARSCLGKHVAETEMLLLTAKLVQQFRIEYDYGEIRSKFRMINVPNKSLRLRFVDRD